MPSRTVVHRIWRVLRWPLWGGLVLLLGAVIALWWANRHDDVLLPDVAAAMTFSPPDAEAMRRNGYFIMLGLGAPPAEDARTAGQRFFAAQLADYERYQQSGDFAASTTGSAFKHRLVELGVAGCHAEVSDCYAHYLKHTDAIRALSAQHLPLTTRYLSLRDPPEYTEVIPPYAGSFANYADVVAASQLVGMQAALALHAGHAAEAWRLLDANATIHQRLWRGSRTLVGAMIALAVDMRHQRLVSDMARASAPITREQANRWASVVNTPATTLAAALVGERNFSLVAYGPISSKDPVKITEWGEALNWLIESTIVELGYLPNATANAAYASWAEAIHNAGLPANQLATRSNAPAEHETALLLRNPIGQLMLGSALNSTISYVERTHDVEGHRRLVRLQILALREQITSARMPEWLAQQPPGLRNPYTLQPMEWDAAAGALVFEGRQAQTLNPEPRNIYRVALYAAPR